MRFSLARWFTAAISFALAGAAPAFAQTDEDVMAAYSAYMEASEAGDSEAILREAKKAYELAEAIWGAREKHTARLAANYAQALLNTGAFETAAQLFGRCAQILASFEESPPVDQGLCLLGQGEARQRLSRNDAAESSFLEAIALVGSFAEYDVRATSIVGQSYLNLALLIAPVVAREARADVPAERVASELEPARQYALRALPLLILAFGDGHPTVGLCHLVFGYYYEWRRDWEEARENYRKAFDILWATLGEEDANTRSAQGRYAHASAMMGSKKESSAQKGRRKKACYEHAQDGEILTICARHRQEPEFPPVPMDKNFSGFTFLLFDINEKGRVVNPRVLESWPGKEFDDQVMRALRFWRYDPPRNQNGEIVYVRDFDDLVRFELVGW